MRLKNHYKGYELTENNETKIFHQKNVMMEPTRHYLLINNDNIIKANYFSNL